MAAVHNVSKMGGGEREWVAQGIREDTRLSIPDSDSALFVNSDLVTY